ncbi:MAG: hypothetical protein HKN03_15175 [Acidimicrobiales bacterium]|nr:hypothetical protein [Acidimicrobiales bacterium]
MRSLHIWLGWAVVLANLITGLWSFLAHWRQELRLATLVPTIYAGWGLTSLQVTVGVLALQSGENDAGGLHYFYGFLCLAAIAVIYSYRPQMEEWQYLLFGLGNLFIMGLALRAVFLDPIPV